MIPQNGDWESDPDWVRKVYCIDYADYWYKGGGTKLRMPSWTDRILWRSNGGHAIELLAYDCEKTVKTSDHRAVRAIFNVPTIVNTDKTGTAHSMRRKSTFGRHESQVCTLM